MAILLVNAFASQVGMGPAVSTCRSAQVRVAAVRVMDNALVENATVGQDGKAQGVCR